MTESIIIRDEAAENASFKAAQQEGLIPHQNEYAYSDLVRRVFGLGFRLALGYLRFKDFTPEKAAGKKQ